MTNAIPGEVLLSGVVGSMAYGLNGPDSDEDQLGVYAAPTAMFHGLWPPNPDDSTVVTLKPDSTFHEALKFSRLALKCNPSVLELLWLPSDLYKVRTGWGDYLIEIRHAPLSRQRVRGAYLGYATDQVKRLGRRGDGSYASDLRKRTAKHTRHVLRLLTQGLELYSTGEITVRLPNPEWYMEFGERVADDPSVGVQELYQQLGVAERGFDEANSPLPERPDEHTMDEWLRLVRDDM